MCMCMCGVCVCVCVCVWCVHMLFHAVVVNTNYKLFQLFKLQRLSEKVICYQLELEKNNLLTFQQNALITLMTTRAFSWNVRKVISWPQLMAIATIWLVRFWQDHFLLSLLKTFMHRQIMNTTPYNIVGRQIFAMHDVYIPIRTNCFFSYEAALTY